MVSSMNDRSVIRSLMFVTDVPFVVSFNVWPAGEM